MKIDFAVFNAVKHNKPLAFFVCEEKPLPKELAGPFATKAGGPAMMTFPRGHQGDAAFNFRQPQVIGPPPLTLSGSKQGGRDVSGGRNHGHGCQRVEGVGDLSPVSIQ